MDTQRIRTQQLNLPIHLLAHLCDSEFQFNPMKARIFHQRPVVEFKGKPANLTEIRNLLPHDKIIYSYSGYFGGSLLSHITQFVCNAHTHICNDIQSLEKERKEDFLNLENQILLNNSVGLQK